MSCTRDCSTPIGDVDATSATSEVLIEEGTAVGLDAAEIVGVLRDQRYLDGIEEQTRVAIGLGVSGVPAWVIDQRLLVPGAQPHEVFARALEQAGHAPLDGSS